MKKTRRHATKEYKKKFFDDIAANCQYGDLETTKDVYYALIKTIMQTCSNPKGEGVCLLPEFGHFELRTVKSKRIRNINTGEIGMAKEFKTFKFHTINFLKKYINSK